MNDESHVVALCGSLRDASKTRIALRETLEAARSASATTDLVDLRNFDLPPFDPDSREAGDAAEIRRIVDEADAVVFGSPNYHGSYSAPLKNALDYCGRDEFEGTTVGLLVVAGGDFPTPALEHLRTVARTLNAWTLPTQVAIPSAYSLVEEGEISDPAVADRVATLGERLAAYAGVEQYPEAVRSASAVAD